MSLLLWCLWMVAMLAIIITGIEEMARKF